MYIVASLDTSINLRCCSIVAVVALQEQRGGLDVVLLGGDVEGGQTHAAPRVVLQQDRHDPVVALLQGDGQRGEPVLCSNTGHI